MQDEEVVFSLTSEHDDYDEPSEEGVDANTTTHLTDEVQAVYFMRNNVAQAFLSRSAINPAHWALYLDKNAETPEANRVSYEAAILLLGSIMPEVMSMDIIYSLNRD